VAKHTFEGFIDK